MDEPIVKLNWVDYLVSFDTQEERDRVWDLNEYPLRYSKMDSSTIKCMHRGHVNSISDVVAKYAVYSIIIEKTKYYIDYNKSPEELSSANFDKLECLLLSYMDSFKSACKKPYFLIYQKL